ncbi:MAG: DEAD/DEAH box helicase [Christensenellales bacterium]
MSDTSDFTAFDISGDVLRAIDAMGISEATTVQKETIPLMMAGADLIAIAPTGTGKTLAFAVPMLEYISLTDKRVQEVVIAPTRELAMQITDEIRSLARFIPNVSIASLYGGQPISRQLTQLRRKPQIVVATPGRMIDMMNRGHLRLDAVHTMVIDEADELLKMGFVKDVSRIIEAAPPEKQLVMFSATTNPDVMTISWKYQHEPKEIVVQAVQDDLPPITQYTFIVNHNEKMERLVYLLDSDEYNRVMVFTNTKSMTQRVCDRLKKVGYHAEALHGDIRQSQRTAIMNGFKRGKFPILVATDVAARGIDVFDVEAVINYDLPNENEYYLHRIGRTGRARRHGVSFTMLTYQDTVRMDEILQYVKTKPIRLQFDSQGILRTADGEAFFEHI